MSHLSLRIAALAVAAGPTLASAQDITIVSKVALKAGATPTTSTQYLASDRIRTSDGENDTIFEMGTGKMTVISHKDKSYFEFTRDDVAAAMAQFEQQMAGPAGAMFEKMMGGKVGEVTVTRAGASRKVAGYDCDPWNVSMGENFKYEVCAAPALVAPVHYYDALKGPTSMMGPMSRRFEKIFEEMKKIKGFPVAMNTTLSMMGKSVTTTTEATEIRKGPIAASAFAVPAGYKKKDSPFKR